MSNTNAIMPYIDAALQDAIQSIGVTQFQGDTGWQQTIGGLLLQGSRTASLGAESSTVIPFFVGFPKQTLGVFVQAIYGAAGAGNENSGIVTAVTLNQFTLINDGVAKQFYWWAIGV
jgi:hypothetical protein